MATTSERNLITEIKKAFSEVHLEDGISLNMTMFNDSGHSAKEYLEKAEFDERNDW